MTGHHVMAPHTNSNSYCAELYGQTLYRVLGAFPNAKTGGSIHGPTRPDLSKLRLTTVPHLDVEALRERFKSHDLLCTEYQRHAL